MNKIKLDLLPLEWWNKKGHNVSNLVLENIHKVDPYIMFYIDNEDIFLNELYNYYIPAGIPEFLFNEYDRLKNSEDYNVFNGILLIGTCGCGCFGCADLLVKITTDEIVTKWEIMTYNRINDVEYIINTYIFDANEYKEQIDYLINRYYSYSWEDENHRIRRICNEFIRKYKTKNGINIEGVEIKNVVDENGKKTNELGNVIEVYYYDKWKRIGKGYGYELPYNSWKLEWNGKTIENAIEILNAFANNELILNENKINLRPYPFPLIYARFKRSFEEYEKKLKKHNSKVDITAHNETVEFVNFGCF